MCKDVYVAVILKVKDHATILNSHSLLSLSKLFLMYAKKNEEDIYITTTPLVIINNVSSEI